MNVKWILHNLTTVCTMYGCYLHEKYFETKVKSECARYAFALPYFTLFLIDLSADSKSVGHQGIRKVTVVNAIIEEREKIRSLKNMP